MINKVSINYLDLNFFFIRRIHTSHTLSLIYSGLKLFKFLFKLFIVILPKVEAEIKVELEIKEVSSFFDKFSALYPINGKFFIFFKFSRSVIFIIDGS